MQRWSPRNFSISPISEQQSVTGVRSQSSYRTRTVYFLSCRKKSFKKIMIFSEFRGSRGNMIVIKYVVSVILTKERIFNIFKYFSNSAEYE